MQTLLTHSEVEEIQSEPALSPTISWLTAYTADIRRYVKHRKKESLVAIFITEQGLWALFQYRIASAIYQSTWPWLVKRPLLVAMVLWQKLIEILTGITLPYAASIGPGFYIGHYGNIIVNGKAIIGENCNISQGVTIGESGYGQKSGVPVIGDRVYIAANAVVVGKIHVGNDVIIAANSLVNRDVPEHTTVVGVPAKVVSTHSSGVYLDP